MITAANYYTHEGELFLIIPFILLAAWAVFDNWAKNRK
jgi:flagellar biogenesis protein FliO